MINFKLKDIEKINPVGQKPNLYLSWFWLTDGELWLKIGDATIYEYTNEAINYFGNKKSPYNEYYIVRFLEDFTNLFEKIRMSIPDNLFKITENLNEFRNETSRWLNIYDNDGDEYPDFYFEEYYKLTSWINERGFDSYHLIDGPELYFFRNKNKIRIIWEAESDIENGISIWTAKDGSFEMNYSDFITEIKIFGQYFFDSMDKQIELTIAKDWEGIKVDKERLLEEQKERKLTFNKHLLLLENAISDEAYWDQINELFKRMKSEITNI